jgi:hypothetical protein
MENGGEAVESDMWKEERRGIGRGDAGTRRGGEVNPVLREK